MTAPHYHLCQRSAPRAYLMLELLQMKGLLQFIAPFSQIQSQVSPSPQWRCGDLSAGTSAPRCCSDVDSVISSPLIFGNQITAFSHTLVVSKEAVLVSLCSWQHCIKPLPTYSIMNRNLSSYRRPYPPSSCKHKAWTCKCMLIHGLTQRYFSWSPSEVAIQVE